MTFFLTAFINSRHNVKISRPRIVGISFFFYLHLIHEFLIDFRNSGVTSILFLFYFVLLCRCVCFSLLTKLFVGCFYFEFTYRTLLLRFSCHDNQPPLSVFSVFLSFRDLRKYLELVYYDILCLTSIEIECHVFKQLPIKFICILFLLVIVFEHVTLTVCFL